MERTSSKSNSSGNAIASLAVGFILAVLMLAFGFSSNKTNFEELALGKETQSYFAVEDGISVHCKNVKDAEKCLEGFSKKRTDRAVLWLGNSQVHAVNQLKPGQETATPKLYRWLSGQGRHLLTFSQANASFQEHYVMFTYLKERLPLSILIIGAVFDDTRESGIRDDISLAFADAPTVKALGSTGIGGKILLDNRKVEAPNADFAGMEDTVQKTFESAINKSLDENMSLWSNRKQMRGEIYRFLYRTRNAIFGIKPSSKRRLLKGRYDLNIQALEAMLESARKSGIKVLLYTAPLRNDVPTPYIMSEYEMFKMDMQDMALKYEATYANLEDIVPGEYWGMKDSTSAGGEPEYDFMHFNSFGHEILARTLQEKIRPLLR
jgi:hypothetical protein